MKKKKPYAEKKSHTNIFFYFLGRIAILLAILLLFYIYYLLFYPVQTIVYKNLPFPTIGKIFNPGQAIPFKVSYCKYLVGESQVVGGIADGSSLTIGTRTAISIPGCHSMISENWKIPADTPPGIYRLIFVQNFLINQFRTIQVATETQSFTVK